MSVSEHLEAWIPQVQGQYIDMDSYAGAQCWDLAAHWSVTLGLPVINTGGNGRWPGWAGNVVDAFPQSDAIASAYELIQPESTGEPGDIVVWDDSYWYYPKTHVAVLVRDLGGQLLCMSQNSTPSQAGNPYPQWTSGPTTIQHLPRTGLLGFIRPRSGMGITPASSIITTLEEAGMALTIEELQAIQGFVQTERETVVKEVRANATATVNAVTDALDKAVWAVKTFDQSTDNENADRIIHDFRAQLQAIRDEFGKAV